MSTSRSVSPEQSRRSGGDDDESQKSTESATDEEDSLTPSSKRKNKNGLKPILLPLICFAVFVGSTVTLSLVAYNQHEEQPKEEFQLRVSVLKFRISRDIFLAGFSLIFLLCYIVISV
jgi:hypothetical protein